MAHGKHEWQKNTFNIVCLTFIVLRCLLLWFTSCHYNKMRQPVWIPFFRATAGLLCRCFATSDCVASSFIGVAAHKAVFRWVWHNAPKIPLLRMQTHLPTQTGAKYIHTLRTPNIYICRRPSPGHSIRLRSKSWPRQNESRPFFYLIDWRTHSFSTYKSRERNWKAMAVFAPAWLLLTARKCGTWTCTAPPAPTMAKSPDGNDNYSVPLSFAARGRNAFCVWDPVFLSASCSRGTRFQRKKRVHFRCIFPPYFGNLGR